jgi:hypothetical protein
MSIVAMMPPESLLQEAALVNSGAAFFVGVMGKHTFGGIANTHLVDIL